MRRTEPRSRVLPIVAAGLLTVAFAMPASAAKPSEPPGATVDLQLLAFNDYHGHLEATTPGTAAGQPAGGGAYLATHLKQLAQQSQHSLTVAAGDLIGGSPFLSGLFHDEPSVESLNAIGLDVSSVGNHEFDEGVQELLRMQNGGCHPVDGCYFKQPYAGADFPWLAANVVSEATGETVLPPYWITQVENVKVGFIGMTLEATPTLVAQSGIVGWDFLDEAETANALVPELTAQGVEAIVVLVHEGGNPTDITDLNSCVGVSGPIIGIQNRLHPEIDAVITGHTHQPYNCVMTDPAGQPRRVTSAFSYGRVISEVNLFIDRASGEVVRDAVTATNHLVDQTVRPDQNVMKVLEKWAPLAEELGSVAVGEATAAITRAKTPSGSEDRGSESDLSNLIADAQLWATQPNGADIAFMNPGGVRADLDAGVITYAEAFNVQPFSNILMTFPMTGEQIISVLEEQCQPLGASRPFLHLGVPEGFSYDLARTIQEVPDPDEPTETILACTAVSVTNVQLAGAALDPAATYMVTVNNFLADGGDNFDTFEEVDPALRIGGGIDLDEFVRYLTEFSPVSPPGTDRVNEL